MTRISKDKRSYAKFTEVDEHDEFLSRISKTLYYTKLPVTDCLSLPVTELAAEIFTEVRNGQTLERLDVEEASRISRNACVSPCSLVLALLYLERLKDCNPEYLQTVVPSELFLVSLMVASKFLHDDGEEDEVFNSEWAHSGYLSIKKLNRLEKEFLQAINWTVYVHNQDFWQRLHRLEKDIAYKEARKRGWFSYTELNTLLDTVHLAELVNAVLSVSSICIVTYAAGLIALLGSAVIASHLPGTLINTKQMQSSSLLNLLQTTTQKVSTNELEEQIESILLDSISEEFEICNESHVENYLPKQHINGTNEEGGWEWIIDSITFWLPNSSSIKSQLNTHDQKNMYDQSSIYVTKTDFMVEADPFSRYVDNQVENVMSKEVLDSTLKISPQDWRCHNGYFSKLSLSRGH